MSEENRSGRIVVIIVIIVLVLAGAVAGWYGFVYKPEQDAKEKARKEQLLKEAEELKKQQQQAENEAKYKQLIEEGDAAFQQEDWSTARSRYSEASGLFPDQKYAKDQLALVNAKLDELAAREARKVAGEVESLNTPNGRFHVIVSSSIDDDLAMDYAKKLAKQGNAVKMLRHETDEHIFFRVSVADYSSREEAESSLGSLSDFGEGLWVLQY
ncbi:SPOR domain-containing protein [Marinoscillum sp.]|uniref:SPOR domain-containing protein n=1 Tax=Marinoscillum sp. TaxID=2024838 RepID=UPI003BAC7BEF